MLYSVIFKKKKILIQALKGKNKSKHSLFATCSLYSELKFHKEFEGRVVCFSLFCPHM